MFDSVPATTGASAVEVLGQPAFETAGRPDALLVSDSSHHRLLAFRR